MSEQDPLITTTSDDAVSEQQQIVLLVLQICSASLSVVGSSTILFKIWHDRAQNIMMTPYDRIIIGLSSCDIIQSITLMTMRFLSPGANVWGFGNEATCQVSGLLVQMSISAIWYNCLLSFYFLMTVLSQVRRKNYVSKAEVWMHFSVLFIPITALLGLLMGWYGETGTNGGCWIVDPVISWIVGGFPVTFTYIALVANNIVIYRVVRKSLRSAEHVASTLTPVQKRLQREATTLMFLYVTFFFVTMTPTIVETVFNIYFGSTIENSARLYPLLLFQVILYPLQGFFNFFIYIRPMYTRFRIANPDKSMYFVLHQALFNPNVPQLAALSNRYSATHDIVEGDGANPNRALFNSHFQPQSFASDSSTPSASYPEGLLDILSEEDDAKDEISKGDIEDEAKEAE